MNAIYARQSVDKKDSISIDSQIDLCKKEFGGENYKKYIDKGYSGKNTERPALKELLNAIKSGEVKKVAVYRLDRISRSIVDFGRIWEIFNQHEAEFVSVNEKLDTTTPSGRAMIYIIMVFAQLERETIAERIKDNYYQRAKRGNVLGGPASFGFNIKTYNQNGKKVKILEANSDIEAVKNIFNDYAYTSKSLGKIAKEQNKKCDSVAIARILHNPVYVKADADVYYFYMQKKVVIYNEIEEFNGDNGCWLVGKRDRNLNKYNNIENHLLTIANHKGVIDSKTWLLCQYKLDNNKQIGNSGQGKYTWLSGLVKCGYCGYGMKAITANNGKYVYFICSGKTNYNICNAKFINPHIAYIEKYVAEHLKVKYRQYQNSKLSLMEQINGGKYKIELAKIDGQISNLIDGLANGGVAAKYISEKIEKLEAEKNKIFQDINEIKEKETFLEEKDFDTMSFESKKEVAQHLIDKVILTNEKIHIKFNF